MKTPRLAVKLSPKSAMRGHNETVCEIEWALRARLYAFHRFEDDSVVEAHWVVNAAVSNTGWGYERLRRHSDTARSAYAIEPFLKERGGLERLHRPEVVYDEKKTEALRRYVRHTLDVAQANGCVLEMILQDTHTCEHHPERFDA